MYIILCIILCILNLIHFGFVVSISSSPFQSFYMVPAEAFEVAQQAAQPVYPEVMTLKRKRAGPDNTPDFDGLWATRG